MPSRRSLPSLTALASVRRLVPVVVSGAVSLCLCGPAAAAAPQARSGQIDTLAAEVRDWVFDEDPNTAAWIEARVAAGLPAGVLAGLADACRQHPRVDLLGVLMELSEYRRPEVRARALAARAELGGQFAVSAIEAAADDLDPGVRKVAVALAGVHPSAAADEVLAQLRALDPEVAAMTEPGAVPAAPPAAPDEDEEIEIIEEEGVPFNQVDPGTPLDVDQPPPDMLRPLHESGDAAEAEADDDGAADDIQIEDDADAA